MTNMREGEGVCGGQSLIIHDRPLLYSKEISECVKYKIILMNKAPLNLLCGDVKERVVINLS